MSELAHIGSDRLGMGQIWNFRSVFSTFGSASQNVLKTDLQVPELSHFGANLFQIDAKSNMSGQKLHIDRKFVLSECTDPLAGGQAALLFYETGALLHTILVTLMAVQMIFENVTSGN